MEWLNTGKVGMHDKVTRKLPTIGHKTCSLGERSQQCINNYAIVPIELSVIKRNVSSTRLYSQRYGGDIKQ